MCCPTSLVGLSFGKVTTPVKSSSASIAKIKVALVTAVCALVVFLACTQILHIDVATPILGLVVLYLAYLVSSGWTPLPEWKPAHFWSVAIVLTAFVELGFASWMR